MGKRKQRSASFRFPTFPHAFFTLQFTLSFTLQFTLFVVTYFGMTAMHSISTFAPATTKAATTTVLRAGGESGKNARYA